MASRRASAAATQPQKAAAKAQQQKPASGSSRGGRQARSKEMPKTACPWINCEKSECQFCGQSSHDVDFDSPPGQPQWVLWTQMKKKTDARGRQYQVTSGCACAHCKNNSRSTFCNEKGEELEPDQLLQELEKPEVSEKFFLIRRARVRGEKKEVLKHGKVNVYEIEKASKAFKKRFRSGRFWF